MTGRDWLDGGTPGREPVELQWRRTWTDDLTVEDYLAIDGPKAVGRIYDMPGHAYLGDNKWNWFVGTTSGHASSRREAMLKVEAAYNAWRAARPL
jgi:hypothetical protein